MGVAVGRFMCKRSPLIEVHISGYGVRHTFTILAFLGFVNIYAMNVCLSVVIVAMVANVGKIPPLMTSMRFGLKYINFVK